jgi:hypothetical protein
VEFEKPFVVMPDATGRVDLNYRVPFRTLTWILSGAAFMALLGLCLVLRRADLRTFRSRSCI